MRRHIRTKILAASLGVLLSSLLLAGLLCGGGMVRLREICLTGNEHIGRQAAAKCETSLTQQALSDGARLAGAKAEAIHLRLSAIADSLAAIGAYTHRLYTSPETFPRLPFSHANENPAGVLAMQWVLSPGMSAGDRGVCDEIGLHGNLESLYASVMEAHPEICSIYFTSQSGINSGYDAYSHTKPDYFEARDLTWYARARDTGAPVISDAYEDSFGRGLMVSMSIPCYGAEGTLAGVAGLDILIQDLEHDILETTVGVNGYAMLFARDGGVICAPGLPFSERKAPGTAGRLLGEAAPLVLAQMAGGAAGTAESVIGGQAVRLLYAPVELNGWSVVLALPTADLAAPAREAGEEIAAQTQRIAGQMQRQMLRSGLAMLGLFLLVTAVSALLTLNLSRRLTKPIRKLTDSVRSLGGDSLDFEADIHTGDEIELLAGSFASMTQELKKYIHHLTKVTADKERIATELHVATQIQTSMLPCIFPAFPDRPEVDIYATMHAAKEVGGDFYDFFLIDGNRLAVVMADVSGKGVPAALFMVIAKTLIKNHTQLGLPPGRVLEAVNRQLCENNDAGMFVTAFMGVLEIETGKFCYANAGHNPPLLARAGGPFAFLDTRPGFVLAGLPDTVYLQQETALMPGDRLFLYTDGVTESLDPQGALYTEERLLAFFNTGAMDGKGVREMLELARADVAVHARGAEQADDITMLALELRGRDGK